MDKLFKIVYLDEDEEQESAAFHLKEEAEEIAEEMKSEGYIIKGIREIRV